MFCKNCGKNLSDGNKFCEYCGASISKNVVNNINPKKQYNKPKRSKELIIAGVIVAFILILGVSFFIFKDVFLRDDSNISNSDKIVSNVGIDKDVSENKSNKNDILKLGNSLNNFLSGGLVAYDDKYIYYHEENSNHEAALYKKNIETNEVKELVKDRAMYINIYEDYIYYVDSVGPMIVTDEIKRVKSDGSELETIIPKSGNVAHNGIQIIGDYLYYSVYLDGNSDTATKMDLMKMNLKTLEKYKISTVDKGDTIYINNNGIIEIYLKHRTDKWIFSSMIQINEDKDSEVNILDISDKNINFIIGVYDNELYYKSLDNYNYSKIFKKSIENINNQEVCISAKDISPSETNSLVGKYYIYFLSGLNTLERLNIITDKIDYIKEIDIRMPYAQRDDIAFTLFEVQGNLAYYNQDGKLIIEDSIDINEKSTSNDKSEINFNIFNPNRKLTVDEAMELAYYRVGSRIKEDGMLPDDYKKDCFSIIYYYNENAVGSVYVDLNSGAVSVNNSKWEKYTETKEELQIGTGYGWKCVD